MTLDERVKMQLGSLVVQVLQNEVEKEELRSAISQQNEEISKLLREKALVEKANG